MSETKSLDVALPELLPPESIVADISAYAIEGTAPRHAIRPSTQLEVAAALGVANDAGAAVVPWGGGSQQGLGAPPMRYDIALDMTGLDSVVEYEPADLTVTVEAGMALSKLQALLGERGQWLPLDPPLADVATIGGVLATNASGPTRYRFGTARDLLIGITFALPSGELAKSGGRVVKNVAGYDLGKLQIGALGTLGVITQATFKVAPLPARTDTIAVSAPLERLMSISASLADSLLAINATVIARSPGDRDWRLIVQFAGGAAAVDRSQRDFSALSAGLDVASADLRASLAALESPTVVRSSVAPTSLSSVCQAFDKAGASVVAYPTAGIVYRAWGSEVTSKALADLRKACSDNGRGAVVIERAPAALRQSAGVWGDARGDIELMRRIKAEMDAKSILNPGRYVGGI